MTGRMKWERIRRPRVHESKYGANVVLSNGEITPGWPQDSLARRAAAKMRIWQRSLKPRDRLMLGRTR
jgi:hypothetical protein